MRNLTSSVLFRARYHPFDSLSTSAHIVTHSSVLDPPAAGIIHQRQRAVRCMSRFQCGPHIQLNSYCMLSKSQVPRAGHLYRPLDVCSASALTVPSTCTRHSHVPEVTYPPHLQPLHRRPGTSGRLSLIWPVTYSFNITLALGYIVLGTGPDCKPAPVP